MNLPNKLTVLRVIMVPFFVFFMLTDAGGAANKWIALAIFVIASLTDMLDGYGPAGGQASCLLGHDLPDPVRETEHGDRDRYHCP